MQFKLNCLKYFRRFPAHKQTKILTSAMHECTAKVRKKTETIPSEKIHHHANSS